MAKTFSKIGVATGQKVKPFHVSQSIDAFTGIDAYDISLSGSFNMTGSINGEPGVINPLTASYAMFAPSASYALSALSASYAISASYEIIKEVSSSHANFADNAGSASYADTASFAQSGNGIFSGSFSGSFSGDGSGLTDISIPTGAFGIANTSGSYTYYSDFNSALTAASSGDTVEVFADVTETAATQVILKDGVNINFNGHTYTLDNIGNEHTLTDNNVAVNCTLMNGIVKRINGPASNTNGLTLKQDSASSKYRCYTMQFINDNGTATRHDGVLEGGYYEGGLYGVYQGSFTTKTYDVTAFSQTGVGIFANSRIYNSKGYSNGSFGIQTAANTRMYSCVGSSTANSGILAYRPIIMMDCTGESSAADGIEMNSFGNIVNCSGYSTSRYGLRLGNGDVPRAYNCNGYSTANYGIYSTQGSLAVQCTGYSNATAAFYTSTATIKCSALCEFNDPAGSGFYINVTTSNNKIIDCYARVVNSAAYAVNSNGGTRDAYVVNLKGEGMTTLLNIGTNLQSNTPDAYGNILIG